MTLDCQKESDKNGNELLAPLWLLSDDRALYVEGIGHLDQYGSYVDDLWTKGVIYFVRDSLLRRVEEQLQSGVPLALIRPLIEQLNTLNSDIEVAEYGHR